MSRLEILAEFGFERDPFRGVHLETADVLRVKRVLKMAVESRAMVAIIAERGYGKTQAVEASLRELEVSVVRLVAPEKEWLTIGDIERAMILDLTQESPRRTREIRARQLRRVLGEISRQKEIVLVIEEAHRIHGNTLRSLKSIREIEWAGRSPLFAVVMLAQFDPMRRTSLDEVRLRTDNVHMRGLTSSEVYDYIEGTVGRVFEADAIEATSRLSSGRNFLDLQEILLSLMGRAMELGLKKVTPFEVFDLYGGGLKEIRRRVGMSNDAIAKELGVSKASISLIENGKGDKLSDDFGREQYQAFAQVLRKHAQGSEKTKLAANS